LEDWWLEMLLVFELGVVEMLECGDPGLISLLPFKLLVLPFVSALMLVGGFEFSLELLDAFCCASRSCFRNFALRFWNHTCGRNAS
jgi:hypothetical protein